jgi:hypothetical protein
LSDIPASGIFSPHQPLKAPFGVDFGVDSGVDRGVGLSHALPIIKALSARPTSRFGVDWCGLVWIFGVDSRTGNDNR